VPTSSLTVTIWDLSDPSAAAQAASLTKNPLLHATTIAGEPGLVSAATHQDLPTAVLTPTAHSSPGSVSAQATATDTHTDYYVVHGGYEYQLTTDAISGDNATSALQSMVAGFRLTD
jgi:hypothetical protein